MSGRISGCAHLTCFKISTHATGSPGDFLQCFIIFALEKLLLNLILCLSCSRDNSLLLIWRPMFSFSLPFPRTEQSLFIQLSQLVGFLQVPLGLHKNTLCFSLTFRMGLGMELPHVLPLSPQGPDKSLCLLGSPRLRTCGSKQP